MISDVLFEAVEEIDGYLADPVYKDMYAGELRDRILKLRDDMNALRAELDTPPGQPIPPTRTS